MKKLIVVIAAVAMAGLTHAATCTWGSGALKTAASADGGWSSTFVQNAGVEVTMKIYLIDSTTYTSLAGKTQKELYDAYSTQSASLTGVNRNPSTDALIGAITINESSAYAGVQYAVAIATYTDTTYGDMYIATLAQTTYNSATSKGNAGSIISNVGNWQGAAVPEPTSGLLMLVGLGALALRRRRA